MPDSLRPLSVELSDVCFVHWPIPKAALHSCVPEWTEPDTVDGSAWVSALAISIDRFDAFGFPIRENLQSVNLRTYVTTPSMDRAVCFLSIDVNDRIAADAMGSLFRLPAHHAEFRRRRTEDGIEVVARRRDGSGTRLTASFDPVGEPTATAPDTLASFLVDRDRYVTTGPLGRRLVGSVGHPPWPLQPADGTIREQTLLDAAGIEGGEQESLVHYSPGLEMTVGGLETL